MAVKIRLTRVGRKKRPYYRIVAVDERKKRDGAYLERLGYYHPLEDPPGLLIDADKALKWLHNGAQPSDTVRSLMRREGVWYRFHLERLARTGKLEQAKLNEMMQEWFQAHPRPESKLTTSKPEPAAVAVVEETEPARAEINVEAEPAESGDASPTGVN